MTHRAQGVCRSRNQLDMQLVSSRTIPLIDGHSLEHRQAREVLFRTCSDRFVLYLSDGKPSLAEERVIFLDLREALIWLNETSKQHGSFWA